MEDESLKNYKEISDKISKLEEESVDLKNQIRFIKKTDRENPIPIFTFLFICVVLIIALDETPGPRGPRGFNGTPGTTTIKHQYEKVGPRGPQGARGPEGGTIIQYKYEKIGPKGPQGIQGPIGSQGPKGIAGPVGPKGEIGPEGPQGVQGIQGPKGERGSDGTLPIIELALSIAAAYLICRLVIFISYRLILAKKIKIGKNLFLRWKKKL